MLESLYKIDFVGISPHLHIFKNEKYKSILSLIISIVIIFNSMIFTIFSLIDYFKNQTPTVIYSKANDLETNRKINIKDSILVFQLVDVSNKMKINSSIAYFEGEYKVMYDNGTYDSITLEIENCEIGKNIDIKYKDYFDNKYNYNREFSDYYINFSKKNFPLFYLPNVGYSYYDINIVKNNQIDFPSERIQSLIASENDLIDHYNKKIPITENSIYYFTSSFSSTEFTNIMYYFQYIKYESDEGFFYEKSKKYDGISFSDITFYKSIKQNYDLNNNTNKDNIIGSITIEINQSNFDSYKRSYKKFQALLAEIMSVISLLLEIGRQISIILCDKNMCKDIIFNLINNNIESNMKKQLSLPNTKINILNTEHKKINLVNERRTNRSSIKNSVNYNIEKSYESKLSKENKIKNFGFDNEKNNNQNYINKVNKKINYLHIIKSFFCFNDKKTKLIDLCHNIVKEDISIERIFERFYNLEKGYHLLSDMKNKILFNENRKLYEANKYINEIYNEEINQKIKTNNSEINLR